MTAPGPAVEHGKPAAAASVPASLSRPTGMASSAPTFIGPSGLAPPDALRSLQESVALTVIGYEEIVRLLAIALVSEGHVLLEGAPGIAKTFLVRRFADSLRLSFKRIQFTPDMLPSDIVGAVVLNPSSGAFEYRPGPIFANVILADEINRAPPKVQSALLEAMQEHQVTVDGVAHPVPSPFIVIATQNPIEQEGTYPLPEAELDRLLFRILIGYPGENDERTVVSQHSKAPATHLPPPALEAADLVTFRDAAFTIHLAEDVLDYVVSIIRETRHDPSIMIGASPRAGVQFARAAKAEALFAGRSYVTPDDVKSVAFWVLNHRIALQPELVAAAYSEGTGGLEPILRKVLSEGLERRAVPR
ncbi:MAG: AAA family ATPase [Thermoplasmata archaeon]|nr:AAA family ATPase [Thermoplasmata archaeon]MCI4359810.1 AAA family ATPase [Thermoplasmata archaeon]